MIILHPGTKSLLQMLCTARQLPQGPQSEVTLLMTLISEASLSFSLALCMRLWRLNLLQAECINAILA